jgi:outer membrane lipase/esterase
MRMIKLVIAAVTLALFGGSATAKPFTQLWIFGDSSVDSGSYKIAPFTGNQHFDVFLAPTTSKGPTGAQKWGIGKPTSNPGPMNSEVLAQLLQLTAVPQNQGGTNYAFSGARNALKNTGCGFPNAVPTTTQINNYLAAHTPGARDLYLIDSGGNDVTCALNDDPSCNTTAPTVVQTAAQALADAIQALQNAGANYIIVATKGESGTEPVDVCHQIYETAIETDLATLNVQYVLGGKGFRTLIESNASEFGLSILGLGSPACPPPAMSTNITTAWGVVCSPTSPASKDKASIAAVSEYADDQHFATGAQKAQGVYWYCLANYTWPNLFVGHQLPPNQPAPPCYYFSSILN